MGMDCVRTRGGFAHVRVDVVRFAIYGHEGDEFEAPLSLDSLQRLADLTYERFAPVEAVVTSPAVRRTLLGNYWPALGGDLTLTQVPIEVDRRFPDDLVCMRPCR